MTRWTILAAIMLAAAAWWLARGIGIPAWRPWLAGDSTDIAACVFIAALILGSRT